jgi:hypothetical protein
LRPGFFPPQHGNHPDIPLAGRRLLRGASTAAIYSGKTPHLASAFPNQPAQGVHFLDALGACLILPTAMAEGSQIADFISEGIPH